MTDTEAAVQADRAWWKEAIVYQIYPKSFADSDGDGIGDLRGIERRVDYLDDFGVDAVWLCPVYESPQADNGYDISDYRSIADVYGDVDDWQRLLEKLHARDIRLIMDLVVNHTSDEHAWFRQSRRQEGKYEDYYYWVDGDPDEPPNNWESIFGGPAWTYDEEREAWYLHLFDEKQPDLNWRNPDVRDDIKSMIEWWLEKGIDGFRMDAISYLSKEAGLPDGDPDDGHPGVEHFCHGPRIDDYFEELYEDVLSNYDIVTVGEMGHTSVDRAAEYACTDGNGLDKIFQFGHMGVDVGSGGRWDLEGLGNWDLRDLKSIMTERQAALGDDGWDALYMGNHDQPRIVSRFGDDGEYRRESATLIATFLLTMRGTPYVYQGEEIGMTNAEFESLDEVDDPQTIGNVEELMDDGAVDSYEDIRELVNYWSRDHARTPMQWSDAENAGFTDGEPWLKVGGDHREINVENAVADEASIWHHYRRLIDLRNDEDSLVYGDYDLLCPDDEQIYAYTRTLESERVLVVLNWSSETAQFDDDVETTDAAVLCSNYDGSPVDPAEAGLRPYEAVVYRL
jgi:oligo-1,6-glucosidase